MAINKIVYGNRTLIDLTGDTATPDKVLNGFTFHDKSGATQTGECTYDADTQDATIAVAEMLDGKTAYARGAKLEGTMPNRGKQTSTISNVDDTISILQGYHDGTGSVGIDPVEKAKMKNSDNIAEGVVLMGITGTHKGQTECKAQAKTVTPTKDGFTVLPDAGYTHLTQVVVNAIPYTESSNAAGGTTVTIG